MGHVPRRCGTCQSRSPKPWQPTRIAASRQWRTDGGAGCIAFSWSRATLAEHPFRRLVAYLGRVIGMLHLYDLLDHHGQARPVDFGDAAWGHYALDRVIAGDCISEP